MKQFWEQIKDTCEKNDGLKHPYILEVKTTGDIFPSIVKSKVGEKHAV